MFGFSCSNWYSLHSFYICASLFPQLNLLGRERRFVDIIHSSTNGSEVLQKILVPKKDNDDNPMSDAASKISLSLSAAYY